ncbi:rhodanese-like domain-containing protein [Brumimicrobium sp.]|uniref:rhodanese-like domain-containing protein n=1 Tax=Brumimicrobium sp. TaxID=2029867 RepID=UPI00261D466D|nr:rhodanese-like domain-containing protein [uncultured Brumimicrobium sp.]
MKTTLTLLIAIFMVSTSSLVAQTESEKKFESVSNEKFQEAIETGEYILIDVRTVAEYEAGHIEGAKLLDINSDYFDETLSNMPKNQKFLVYCASGNRSKAAMDKMKLSGFTHVLELNNGYQGWE